MPHSDPHDRIAPIGQVQIARSLTRCLLICVLASTSGCVALGVPSKRMHDPDDMVGCLVIGVAGVPTRPLSTLKA